jgi:hypothetical protein
LCFQIVADSASSDAAPLPACSDSSWGPGVAVDQLGIVANPPDGIITTEDGKVKLEFKKTKPSYVLCKLRKNGMKDEELEKCISEKDVGDTVQVTSFCHNDNHHHYRTHEVLDLTHSSSYMHIALYM